MSGRAQFLIISAIALGGYLFFGQPAQRNYSPNIRPAYEAAPIAPAIANETNTDETVYPLGGIADAFPADFNRKAKSLKMSLRAKLRSCDTSDAKVYSCDYTIGRMSGTVWGHNGGSTIESLDFNLPVGGNFNKKDAADFMATAVVVARMYAEPEAILDGKAFLAAIEGAAKAEVAESRAFHAGRLVIEFVRYSDTIGADVKYDRPE